VAGYIPRWSPIPALTELDVPQPSIPEGQFPQEYGVEPEGTQISMSPNFVLVICAFVRTALSYEKLYFTV